MSSMRRYTRTNVLNLGEKYGTSYLIPIIRDNIKNGNIQTSEYILQGNERLDTLAGRFYSDGSLWWILAAGSNIGWGLQPPTGTRILVPKLSDIAKFV